MRYFLLTAPGKEIIVEAEWCEQAVDYFKWIWDYDGEVKCEEISYTAACGKIDFYCPTGWNKPLTPKSEFMRNRREWLKNYLGKFYEIYENGVETPEFVNFMKLKGWERQYPFYKNEMDAEDDPFPDAGYTSTSEIWGKYPITLQGLSNNALEKSNPKTENNLQALRTRAGLTQAELAEKTGIVQPRIAKYERMDDLSNLTVGVLQKIADACGASIAEIIKEQV